MNNILFLRFKKHHIYSSHTRCRNKKSFIKVIQLQDVFYLPIDSCRIQTKNKIKYKLEILFKKVRHKKFQQHCKLKKKGINFIGV